MLKPKAGLGNKRGSRHVFVARTRGNRHVTKTDVYAILDVFQPCRFDVLRTKFAIGSGSDRAESARKLGWNLLSLHSSFQVWTERRNKVNTSGYD